MQMIPRRNYSGSCSIKTVNHFVRDRGAKTKIKSPSLVSTWTIWGLLNFFSLCAQFRDCNLFHICWNWNKMIIDIWALGCLVQFQHFGTWGKILITVWWCNGFPLPDMVSAPALPLYLLRPPGQASAFGTFLPLSLLPTQFFTAN